MSLPPIVGGAGDDSVTFDVVRLLPPLGTHLPSPTPTSVLLVVKTPLASRTYGFWYAGSDLTVALDSSFGAASTVKLVIHH